MPRPYSPYIPQTVGEIWDLLGSMALGNPKFEDRLGYFPGMSIDTTFFALKESFGVVRKKLGEERYEKLIDMADRMKALLWEMEDVLNEVRRRKPKPAAND